MARFAETARLRSGVCDREKRNRIAERTKRLRAKRSHDRRPEEEERDPEAKLRSVFAAIRSFNNTDVELDSSMTASELFKAVTEALSHPSAQSAAKESRSLGEALELVSRLSAVLQKR